MFGVLAKPLGYGTEAASLLAKCVSRGSPVFLRAEIELDQKDH